MNWERVKLATRMAAAQGVYLVPLQYDDYGLVVLGTGTGIVMAVADHLQHCYPGLPVLIADMPGNVGFDRRCTAIDYVANVFPTLLVMWNGLYDGAEYPARLASRGFRAGLPLWIYSNGIGQDSALPRWSHLGAKVLCIGELWGCSPLGDLVIPDIEYAAQPESVDNAPVPLLDIEAGILHHHVGA